LGHVTPVAKLKEWQKTHPELFVKKVYNQLRPDIYKLVSFNLTWLRCYFATLQNKQIKYSSVISCINVGIVYFIGLIRLDCVS
ncbi:MAG: hypothetical protein B7Y68_08845, partial [Thiotrichales bacterium 35-46-9]